MSKRLEHPRLKAAWDEVKRTKEAAETAWDEYEAARERGEDTAGLYEAWEAKQDAYTAANGRFQQLNDNYVRNSMAINNAWRDHGLSRRRQARG